jgi:multiple sugar transport system substrate-binding protein
VALMLVCGCSGTPGGAAPTPGSGGPGGITTIQWLAGSITQTANDPRQVLIDAFERAYPAIRVELVTAPASTDSQRSILVKELHEGSHTPDVYLGDVVWPAEFGHGGLALPLDRLPDSFWQRFGTVGTPQYQLVQAVTYHNHKYAAPFFVDEGFLYYRKDLLARIHQRAPTTWEQLEADAVQLRRAGLRYEFVWQGNGYEGLTCDWTEFVTDAAGNALDLNGGQPMRALVATQLDSPAAVKALDFMRGLLQRGISPPQTSTFDELRANDEFDRGQAAFLRGWDSSWAAATGAHSTVADEVGVAPLPGFADHSRGWSVIGGWDLFINPHSTHIDEDLTFIKWMTGTSAQRILASQYQEIPSNTGVRTDPEMIRVNPVLRAAGGANRDLLVSRPSPTTDYQNITEVLHTSIHSGLTSATANTCQLLVTAARELDRDAPGTLPCSAAPDGGG